MPGHPYLCSHSFKLHNWEAEIGFPNLSLLIQSGQFQLRGAGYCPHSPHLNETDGNFLICHAESEDFFRHTFYFLNQLGPFA